MPSGYYDHSSKIIDRTGTRYNRLVVVNYAGRNKFNQLLWLCKCDCGTEKIIAGNKLKQGGGTQSCGCLHKEIVRKTMTGENNYGYIDGNSCGKYTKEILELKEAVRKRDNYICQYPKCKKTQEQNIKETGEILSIHHIDENDTNNIEENLITYCKSCHRRKHTELKKLKGGG